MGSLGPNKEKLLVEVFPVPGSLVRACTYAFSNVE